MTLITRRWLSWSIRALIYISLSLPLYWIGSEVWYARSIQPTGISTVSDFFSRFGEPFHIREVQRDGATYYHLSGPLPPPYILAVPSARPAYIFDESGHFVEWCSDPGDSNAFWERWPQQASHTIDPIAFKRRYGL